MRLPNLASALLEKFVPMDKVERDELTLEGFNKYEGLRKEIIHIDLQNKAILEENHLFGSDPEKYPDYKPKPLLKLTIGHKAIQLCEQWWCRYIFAALFVYLVPKIKAFINGENDQANQPESETDLFQQFQQFRQFKQGMM